MNITSILLTVLILNVLIITHELGHFFAAKISGVRVLEFSIGLGPKLFSKQGKRTLFSLRLFPLGGFCNLQGENEMAEEDTSFGELDPNESFLIKPVWIKVFILIAGVILNFLTGYLILLIAFLIAGFSIPVAFERTNDLFLQMVTLIFTSLKMLATREIDANQLTGPVGMVTMVNEVSNYGLISLLLLTALLAINLGVMNLIPIPALDGGQILIVLVEGLHGGPIKESLKEKLFFGSYFALITLMVYVMYNDVVRLIISNG